MLPPPPNELVFFASGVKLSETPPPPEEHAACPKEMVEIDGEYSPCVAQLCLRWLDPLAHPPLQCAEFAPTRPCGEAAQKKHFCIDRYEWPNRPGVLPAYSLTWYTARDSCAAVGKRLCNDDEWTLACEGPEHLPYPYGYMRNKDACNIDKSYRTPDAERYIALPTRAMELSRLDQREPSGSREACVSPYGVHDMTGNVDEWVVNETGHHDPYISGLKGGYWGPVKTRCRPMTTLHDANFHYYQVGFRCCEDTQRPPTQGSPTDK